MSAKRAGSVTSASPSVPGRATGQASSFTRRINAASSCASRRRSHARSVSLGCSPPTTVMGRRIASCAARLGIERVVRGLHAALILRVAAVAQE